LLPNPPPPGSTHPDSDHAECGEITAKESVKERYPAVNCKKLHCATLHGHLSNSWVLVLLFCISKCVGVSIYGRGDPSGTHSQPLMLRPQYIKHSLWVQSPAWGRGIPFPLVPLLPLLLLFLLFPILGGFNYFLLLSIPYLSTRIVPLCFQVGGRRKRPNLGLVCSFYSLVKMDFGVLLYLV